jgi:hypothetical protein
MRYQDIVHPEYYNGYVLRYNPTLGAWDAKANHAFSSKCRTFFGNTKEEARDQIDAVQPC